VASRKLVYIGECASHRMTECLYTMVGQIHRITWTLIYIYVDCLHAKPDIIRAVNINLACVELQELSSLLKEYDLHQTRDKEAARNTFAKTDD
jgi:hypothetical protein